MLLQPAAGLFGQNDDHLRSVGFLQALLQCFTDTVGAQILVFNVDKPAGRGNAVKVELLHLPHRRSAFVIGKGPGDGNAYIPEIRLHAIGPGIIGIRSVARNGG